MQRLAHPSLRRRCSGLKIDRPSGFMKTNESEILLCPLTSHVLAFCFLRAVCLRIVSFFSASFSISSSSWCSLLASPINHTRSRSTIGLLSLRSVLHHLSLISLLVFLLQCSCTANSQDGTTESAFTILPRFCGDISLSLIDVHERSHGPHWTWLPATRCSGMGTNGMEVKI
jgi:hypothetical protein